MIRIGYRGKTGPAWLRDKVAKLEIGTSLIGWGFVRDRYGMLRIYPIPFVKVTLGKLNGPYAGKGNDND